MMKDEIDEFSNRAPFVLQLFCMSLSVIATATLFAVFAVFMSGIIGFLNGSHLNPSEWPMFCHFIIYFFSTGIANMTAFRLGEINELKKQGYE